MYAEETIWCTQDAIAALFDKSRTTITKHLQNIFKDGELQKDAVCRKFRRTANDGKTYNTQFYNLDVLISNKMKAAGLEFIFTAQQFRAKVEVKISAKSKLTFFVSYKKLQEELSSLIESAKSIKENMEKLGGNATIKKIFSTDNFEGNDA